MWTLIGTTLWLVCGFIGGWIFCRSNLKPSGTITIIDAILLLVIVIEGVAGLILVVLLNHGNDVIIRLKK